MHALHCLVPLLYHHVTSLDYPHSPAPPPLPASCLCAAHFGPQAAAPAPAGGHPEEASPCLPPPAVSCSAAAACCLVASHQHSRGEVSWITSPLPGEVVTAEPYRVAIHHTAGGRVEVRFPGRKSPWLCPCAPETRCSSSNARFIMHVFVRHGTWSRRLYICDPPDLSLY